MRKIYSMSDVLYATVMVNLLVTAWLTNAVICIQERAWATLIITSVLFPFGVLRGIVEWLGL